jgi:hypothetical protein
VGFLIAVQQAGLTLESRKARIFLTQANPPSVSSKPPLLHPADFQ